FFSSRRRHTRSTRDWSSDVYSSDLGLPLLGGEHDRIGGVHPERRRQPVARPHSELHASVGVRCADYGLTLAGGGAVTVGAGSNKIGRASCRERGERRGGGGDVRTEE